MAIKNVIEGNFIVDDYNNTPDKVDDSSDEDVKDTFNKIRKSLVQNYTNSDIPVKSEDKEDTRLKILNKRKFSLEDSENNDSENEVTPVKKKVPLDDSYNEANIVQMKTKEILKNNEEEESDTDDNIISKKKKTIVLEDSEEEDVNDIDKTSDLNKNGLEEINSDIRKLPLENSDSEEDIGTFVKKTKYFINDDSD